MIVTFFLHWSFQTLKMEGIYSDFTYIEICSFHYPRLPLYQNYVFKTYFHYANSRWNQAIHLKDTIPPKGWNTRFSSIQHPFAIKVEFNITNSFAFHSSLLLLEKGTLFFRLSFWRHTTFKTHWIKSVNRNCPFTSNIFGSKPSLMIIVFKIRICGYHVLYLLN